MDKNKTNFHILDFDLIKHMADIFKEGSDKRNASMDDWKYFDKNLWEKELEPLYFDAALRHLLESLNGKSTCEKLSALASVACNAMIMYSNTKRKA